MSCDYITRRQYYIYVIRSNVLSIRFKLEKNYRSRYWMTNTSSAMLISLFDRTLTYEQHTGRITFGIRAEAPDELSWSSDTMKLNTDRRAHRALWFSTTRKVSRCTSGSLSLHSLIMLNLIRIGSIAIRYRLTHLSFYPHAISRCS